MEKELIPDIVEVYVDEAGDYRWHRRSPNNKDLSESGEGYRRPIDCLRMLHHVNARPFDLHFYGKRGRTYAEHIPAH